MTPRLIDADELLGLLRYLEASTPIIEWQSQREAEARKRALWQVRAWVESRVDPAAVAQPDYMHEMLTACPHRPYCHNSWDPCLLTLQHPHAIGATGDFAGPYEDCPECRAAVLA